MNIKTIDTTHNIRNLGMIYNYNFDHMLEVVAGGSDMLISLTLSQKPDQLHSVC